MFKNSGFTKSTGIISITTTMARIISIGSCIIRSNRRKSILIHILLPLMPSSNEKTKQNCHAYVTGAETNLLFLNYIGNEFMVKLKPNDETAAFSSIAPLI